MGGVDVTSPKTDLAAVRRKMGMVFQNFNLFGNLTVIGNVMAAQCDLLRKTPAEAKAARFVDILGKMLADGVISDEESKRISLILNRL